jgi:hypothetical protein
MSSDSAKNRIRARKNNVDSSEPTAKLAGKVTKKATESPDNKTKAVAKDIKKPTDTTGNDTLTEPTDNCYYIFFIHKKSISGEKETGEASFKIGCSNNVRETREMFEQGRDTDLKTYRVIRCANGDAKKLCVLLCRRIENKSVVRDWYRLSKEQVDNISNEIIENDGYELVSESRAVKTVKAKSRTSVD